MQHNDVDLHAQGTSTFTDDMARPEGLHHVYPIESEVAHGNIELIDLQNAFTCPGVLKILLARDIPGINNIGNVETNEVLLAEEEVVYQGQPIALVIAESEATARLEKLRIVNLIG
jgi:xanthine dehydrogenase large subunit